MDTSLDLVLAEFLKLAEIPRPSHHEEKIGAYLVSWAKAHGLAVQQDALGDVIIDKPAAPGCENAPKVLLQAHMDMVCVAAEGVAFDPLHDPIQVVREGNLLRAKGTSLGADDGIGVAMCLYVLAADHLRHGPLRAIFTVNEEDGMTSAQMDGKYLDGQYLINLDWEEDGSLCNSSAGSVFTRYTRKAAWETPKPGQSAVRVRLKGLLGGHSGGDIHLGRANALIALAGALYHLAEEAVEFSLASFTGGQARNAIPATAQAVIVSPEPDRVRQVLRDFEEKFKAAFAGVEPHAALLLEPVEVPEKVLDDKTAWDLVRLLLTLPCGVHTLSPFVPGLVESSQNLGLLTMDDHTVTVAALMRSSALWREEELLRTSHLAASALGFSWQQVSRTAGWAVDSESKLAPLTCAVYKEVTGRDMAIEPVHAGLECGAFSEKNPALDMVSFGPTLRDVHSPGETCDLATVQTSTELLERLLARLAE